MAGKREALSYRSSRKTSQGVLFSGEVKWIIHEAIGKPIARNFCEGQGVLARSHWRETRSQSIYAWAG